MSSETESELETGKRGNTMKRFWTFIKHKRSDGRQIPPLKSEGLLHSEPVEKANILNNQFQNAFSKKTNISKEEFSNLCKMQGTRVSGVEKLLSKLNPTKAAGPDNITPRVLQELAPFIAPILTVIFKISYESGTIPAIWKTANICPVFKKGKKIEAINYRPISLTCISCKLMEHIITSYIMKHDDTHNILYPLQHGYRKGLSCETQLIEFVDDITRNIDAGKQTDCLIMDFSKAFDKVSHSLLQHKLDHYGISGKTGEWIKTFLSDRSQSVVIEGESSDKIPVESGVPQRSVLDPSLFLFI